MRAVFSPDRLAIHLSQGKVTPMRTAITDLLEAVLLGVLVGHPSSGYADWELWDTRFDDLAYARDWVSW